MLINSAQQNPGERKACPRKKVLFIVTTEPLTPVTCLKVNGLDYKSEQETVQVEENTSWLTEGMERPLQEELSMSGEPRQLERLAFQH